MGKSVLTVMFLLTCLTGQAQQILNVKEKDFNVGVKVGFNSVFPIIQSLAINGEEVSSTRPEYKVGYTGSIFCRVNIDRFFIQPGASWNYYACKIDFTPTKPEGIGQFPEYSHQLQCEMQSLEMPILIGYHLVRESPFGLSASIGPVGKYYYKMGYTSKSYNTPNGTFTDKSPFAIGLAGEISVNIGRLFFDFAYDLGLTSTEGKSNGILSSPEDDITIRERNNMMSFSLGFLF